MDISLIYVARRIKLSFLETYLQNVVEYHADVPIAELLYLHDFVTILEQRVLLQSLNCPFELLLLVTLFV